LAEPAAAARSNLVVYQGGTIGSLLQQTGSGTLSLWASVDGRFVGYTVGAPTFVNARFEAAFPGGILPAGPLVILTADGTPSLPPVIEGGMLPNPAAPTAPPSVEVTEIKGSGGMGVNEVDYVRVQASDSAL